MIIGRPMCGGQMGLKESCQEVPSQFSGAENSVYCTGLDWLARWIGFFSLKKSAVATRFRTEASLAHSFSPSSIEATPFSSVSSLTIGTKRVTMPLSTNWKQHFALLASNKDGNKMMLEFSHAITAVKSQRERLIALTEERESIIFITDKNGLINIAHSPTNFGGMRTRPAHKITCLVGMWPLATAVVWNNEQAIESCEIRTATAAKIHECTTAEQFRALVAPREDDEDGDMGLSGEAPFIPAPFMSNFVLEAESKDPV